MKLTTRERKKFRIRSKLKKVSDQEMNKSSSRFPLQTPKTKLPNGTISSAILTRISKEIFWISTSWRLAFKYYRETYSQLKTNWLEQQRKMKEEQKEIQESKSFKSKLMRFNEKK